MNRFLIQIRNKINKIIELNNEIAHERLPNTKQFQEPVAVKSCPPAGRPAFFLFFCNPQSFPNVSPKPRGRPAGRGTDCGNSCFCDWEFTINKNGKPICFLIPVREFHLSKLDWLFNMKLNRTKSNKINKIIKLNNEIAHERIPNTN